MNIKNYFFVFLIFLSSLFLLSASFYVSHVEKRDKPYIVVTTTMLKDAISNLMKDDAYVETLMGPGIDPHVYRPRESDIHRLLDADLILYHGLHLEGKMAHMFEMMNSWKPTYNVSACLSESFLIETDCAGIYDPHVWHDVLLWQKIVINIAARLKEQFPEFCQSIDIRLNSFISELSALHNQIVLELSRVPIEKRVLITAHDAFSYLGRRYDIQVIGLQGVSTDAEIGTHDICSIADIIEKHRVSSIFLESSVSPKAIQALQQAVKMRGLQVRLGEELYSDALGDNESNAHTYIGMMKYNTKAFLLSVGATSI